MNINIKKISLAALSLVTFVTANAQVIEGIIVDQKTKEPMIGVSVYIKETYQGTATDHEGKFTLSGVKSGQTLETSYLSYDPITMPGLQLNSSAINTINLELKSSQTMVDEVVVVRKKNLESANVLKQERIASNVAIQNLGVQEMSLKGLSSVEEGVAKITSVAVNDGQLFVRGLGDRYSMTTLNGMSIASPNPDNKIIPLDIFPSSTISNITVSKVYKASEFADYSGAHINIDTRQNTSKDFFKVSFSTGGQYTALTNDFYRADNSSLFWTDRLDLMNYHSDNYTQKEFGELTKKEDIFGSSFAIEKLNSLPDMKLTASAGKNWDLGEKKLSVMASVSADNSYETQLDAYSTVIDNTGVKTSEFVYDSYSQFFNTAALLGTELRFANNDKINYTLFYARNAESNYKLRDGFTDTNSDRKVIGSNSVVHAYSLLNNQLSGNHTLSEKLDFDWSASYGMTKSDEPDRKQVMYDNSNPEAGLSLFTLNQQETMRFFGELDESEITGNTTFTYKMKDENLITFGAAYKNKEREFYSGNFYYNVSALNDLYEGEFDIYDTDPFLNQDNVANGNISITRNIQSRNLYRAGSSNIAAFAELDYNLSKKLHLNAGVRLEAVDQWVEYSTNATPFEDKSEINKTDFFPALNLKYELKKGSSLRFSASKTVTRPSFVEMAPFEYRESYGSASIFGNENIENGYNYNVDLSYDIFKSGSNDMFSAAIYYKHLDSPIERVQMYQEGVKHTFENSEKGTAAGIEIEFKKELGKKFILGANGAYMYTNVELAQEGSNTDNQRALQGASPILANADLTYKPKLKDGKALSLTLLYNYQGERIEAVGIDKMSDIMKEPLSTLDFAANYTLNKKWSFSLGVDNILDQQNRYTQEIAGGEVIDVELYNEGVSFSVGASLNF